MKDKVIAYFSKNTRMVVSEDLSRTGTMRVRTQVRLGTDHHPIWQESAIEGALIEDRKNGLAVDPLAFSGKPYPLGYCHGTVIYWWRNRAKKTNSCFFIEDGYGNRRFMASEKAAAFMIRDDFIFTPGTRRIPKAE